MEELELGGWSAVCDPAATRRATARIPEGAAAACGCEACARFVALRAELLSDALREALERLGCDPAREAELELLERTRGGGFRVLVAWRFVGRVLDGPEDDAPFRLAPEELESGTQGRVTRIELELELPPAAPEAV